jgi:hypothetical protein
MKKPRKPATKLPVNADGVVLLSGGNPQIAKGDGDAPVQAYIAAMPEWKQAVGIELDAIISTTFPDIEKAVRWNSPFYAVPGKGWMVSFHVFTRYVRLTFLDGIHLSPLPPGGTPKSGNGRWFDIHEKDAIDRARIESWLHQAAKLPGWKP